MTYIPAKYIVSSKSTDHADFGVTDAKGRKVGASIKMHTLDITDDKRNSTNGIVAEPHNFGTWYCYSIQSTRNGKDFGASAKTSKFRSRTERDAKAVKAFDRSRKLAIKKHGGA
jgi:hypothetical protein